MKIKLIDDLVDLSNDFFVDFSTLTSMPAEQLNDIATTLAEAESLQNRAKSDELVNSLFDKFENPEKVKAAVELLKFIRRSQLLKRMQTSDTINDIKTLTSKFFKGKELDNSVIQSLEKYFIYDDLKAIKSLQKEHVGLVVPKLSNIVGVTSLRSIVDPTDKNKVLDLYPICEIKLSTKDDNQFVFEVTESGLDILLEAFKKYKDELDWFKRKKQSWNIE